MAQMATDKTARKVTAATAAASVAVLVVSGIEALSGNPLPDEISAALTAVVTAISTWAAGYYTLPAPRDQVVPAASAGGAPAE
ncbi:hypothetical protein E4L95_03430 [Paracoccus liaowanqingii]|uniref:Holin n=1 Tax=Paracoccus liaowanqingii TaxID=2560053 RepID=A0A4Z1CRL6_9RHOB|nr:hypothetical protein [Paracoccus liaowanqingii]TGN67876.1 hypothetical protein E4L95_03430 [Paracoccus liaowanqingii]